MNDCEKLKKYLKLDKNLEIGGVANFISNKFLLIGDTKSIIR